MSEREQLARALEVTLARIVRQLAPVEPRGLEGGGRIGIGNAILGSGAAELGKPLEFTPPSIPNGSPQFALEIAEEAEWASRAPFLAHEQERHMGREQK